MSNLPAMPLTVRDIIDEHNHKNVKIDGAVKALEDAYSNLEMTATVQGTFVETVANKPYLCVKSLRRNLLRSGWKATYNRLGIANLASAKDRQLFERTLTDPPELTLDNAKATFGDYMKRPRFHTLRGLAEVLTSLDPAYKSHSNVRMGVKGLPKRIVLSGWGSFHSSYCQDRFRDLVNALAVVREQQHFDFKEIRAIDTAFSSGQDAVLDGKQEYNIGSRHREEPFRTIDRGLTLRNFKNGNVHIFFDKWALLDINRALSEFYGEVLPDVEDKPDQKRASTEVAKDLQYYWTPPSVIDEILQAVGIYSIKNYAGIPPTYDVLEPSCGDGLIMDEIEQRGSRVYGYEVDHARAVMAKNKGHAVVRTNFLEVHPEPIYDRVVMNPPFYGKHYLKHVRHALEFLKPGGMLVSILPASAHYDHGELKGGHWQDLPVASFADAGTNVPTGYYIFQAPR